jgi:arginyl-tRNA--protein-N-Asp/Glu arginylyltransferase
VTSSLRDLKVYTTYPHRCSYLEGEEATTLFIDPRQSVDKTLYSNLSMLGFRRSGNHIYRPHCSHCNACIPARIPVDDFRPNRSQRRCRSRNADLDVEVRKDHERRRELRALRPLHPRAPRRRRHVSAGPGPVRVLPQRSLGLHRVPVQFRKDGRLVAVAVVDVMVDGLSAIYTFYDPAEDARSLGRYAILWQVERCRAEGLPYVYLGYWIRNCRKMAYKADYQPLEVLVNNQWQRSTEGLIESF